MYPQYGLIRGRGGPKWRIAQGCSECVPPPVNVPQMLATTLVLLASLYDLTAPPWAVALVM